MTSAEAVERIEEKISETWDQRALSACQDATAAGDIPADQLTDELWRMLQRSEAAKLAWLKQARPEIERIVREADAYFTASHGGDNQ